MFIGAHEAEYMFVTTLLKIEQHLLAQGRCPYKLFRAASLGKQRLGVNRIESVVGSTVVTVHIDRPLLVDQPINFRLTDLQ